MRTGFLYKYLNDSDKIEWKSVYGGAHTFAVAAQAFNSGSNAHATVSRTTLSPMQGTLTVMVL